MYRNDDSLSTRLAWVGRVALLLFAWVAHPAWAQPDGYPRKPVRLIVGYPPGGGSDIMARALSPGLSQSFGQPIVVDNKGGANGLLATQELGRSPPDGYTLMLTNSAHVTNALLYSKQSYNPGKNFSLVSLIATSPFVLVANPSVPVNNLQGLIALAKAKPDSIDYGSPGTGSTQHLIHELLNSAADVKMTHIAYKGGGPMITDLLSGVVQIGLVTPLAAMEFIKSGKFKALAVTSRNRLPLLPNVEAVGETIKGFEADVWYALIAPAGTPKPIVDWLSAETARSLRQPAVRDKLLELKVEPIGSTPEEFSARVDTELSLWSSVIRQKGIKLE